MDEPFLLLLSAVLGAVLAIFGTIAKGLVDSTNAIDNRIHDARTRLYPELWRLTGALPRRGATEITARTLRGLAVSAQEWFYGEGGLYLSGFSRRAYTALQDTIEYVQSGMTDDQVVSDLLYEEVRIHCSILRAALTDDLLSRSGPPTWNRLSRRIAKSVLPKRIRDSSVITEVTADNPQTRKLFPE